MLAVLCQRKHGVRKVIPNDVFELTRRPVNLHIERASQDADTREGWVCRPSSVRARWSSTRPLRTPSGALDFDRLRGRIYRVSPYAIWPCRIRRQIGR